METLPEPQDPIRSFLSRFMSGEDVARYSDLSYVLETIKKDELCWQAAVSIGVHTLVFGFFGQSDEEKAVVKDLAGYALEPMEALHESLTQQARQKPLTDDQALMLFHVRWALGFVFYERGDRQRALGFLHQMAATQLSRFGGGVGTGGDIVTYTDDMRRGKELAARLMSTLCAEMDNYTETLSVIARAADVTGDPLDLLGQVGDLLDRWAARCERIRRQENVDELDAFVEWTVLLTQAGQVLSVCQHADRTGALPSDCERDSAQFLAYKLGQLAARFATECAHLWQDFMEESDQPGGVDFLVEALLCDLEAGPAWRKLRDRYETGWRRTLVYDRASVEEISPAIDLYWAMRIGFADGMLESTQAPLPARPAGAATDLPPDLQTLKDMVGYGNVRLIRLERVTEQLFPPAREAIEQCLRERLGDLWDDLPSDVTDPLISAEYGYAFGWQRFISTGAVLKGFHEAVKACFEWYFARPFAAYLNERRVTRTPVCWGVWQGQPQSDEFFTNKPWCLSLGKWAGALGLVAGRRHPPKNNPQLAAFLGHGWPDLGKDALRQLAGSLRSVQAYRNRWEHSDSPPRPYHTERTELDEMRDLVLGTPKSPSVICRIYDLLGRSKQS